MILSNTEIHRAIDEGDFVIDPEPLPRTETIEEPESPYDTSSLNLLLASALSIAVTKHALSIDLRQGGAAALLTKIYSKKEIDPAGGFSLDPHSFVLGKTIERIGLPIRAGRPSLAARVEGRSSFARCGVLVHFTAPTIHAGFEGTITLEILNLGKHPVMLYPNMRICQLILERVDGVPNARPSQFQGQTTPAGTR